MNKKDIISKIHLIISVLVVVPVAVIYGFSSNLIFDISPETVDEANFLKAIMGLYFGFSVIWLLGIFRAGYLKLALLTNIVFMLGLGLGRLLSLFVDGTPTLAYQFGTFAEILLGVYGFWVLRSKYIKNL